MATKKAEERTLETTANETLTAPPKEEKSKTGRPSKYTPELARLICEKLSEGIPLREICREEGFPAWRTVYDWMWKDEELSTAIAHARDLGYDAMAEDCLRIADTPKLIEKVTTSTDPKTGAEIKSITTFDDVHARKLQVETRLKLLAKFNPKKYGDRLEVAGDANNPLKAQVDVSVFDTLLTTLETRRQAKNGS